ncbi:MAG: hypothetical protein JO092_11900 [Candidatus Eremiobacteraeota bacterium]|nr:hypothetical protein [Candidatus Eremiobacteraeota bacterium]
MSPLAKPHLPKAEGKVKHLFLYAYLLSFCMAGTFFAGCGGPQAQSPNVSPPLQSSAKQSPESLKRAAGGSFAASYAGSASQQQCHKVFYEVFICTQSFAGKGSGSFIHRSSISGSYTCEEGRYGSGGSAQFTFVSKKHPEDSFNATMSTKGKFCLLGATYTVSGGTGKFANASGSLTALFLIKGSTFTASWKGTLNF